MANIEPIVAVARWYLRETPLSSKFNVELCGKINQLITNNEIVNSALEELLQGTIGGSEQAKIPFGVAAAPTGWTRDITFVTDRILRVTDGSTLPSGANPTATGGADGGAWAISGATTDEVGSHTHDLGNHTHSMSSHTHTLTSHTHGIPAHTHSITHYHTIPNQGAMTSGSATATSIYRSSSVSGYMSNNTHEHTTDEHDHGGSTGNNVSTTDAGSGTSGSASSTVDISPTNTTSVPSTNITGTTANHSHTISHDSSWRPKYLNVIICKKD